MHIDDFMKTQRTACLEMAQTAAGGDSYRHDPISTEYLLTASSWKAFNTPNIVALVEAEASKLANLFNKPRGDTSLKAVRRRIRKSIQKTKILKIANPSEEDKGTGYFDLVALQGGLSLACVVEYKIGVSGLAGVMTDLKRLRALRDELSDQSKENAIFASVYQYRIDVSKDIHKTLSWFQGRRDRHEARMRKVILNHNARNPLFQLRFELVANSDNLLNHEHTLDQDDAGWEPSSDSACFYAVLLD